MRRSWNVQLRGRALRAAWAAALGASSILAQHDPCDGNGGGFRLSTTVPVLGLPVEWMLEGPPSAPYFVAFSDALALTDFGVFGVGCLDVAAGGFGILTTGTLPPNGALSFPLTVPLDPYWAGFVGWVQGAAAFAGAPNGLAISNTMRTDFAAADAFEPAPAMATRQGMAGVAVLLNGDIFVAGGANPGLQGILPSDRTRVFNVRTRSWIEGPLLIIHRRSPAATTLSDGRVLISGGGEFGATAAICEIFDPTSWSIAPSAAMSEPREGHVATVLPDGRVVVLGGRARYPNGATVHSATGEIYDPTIDQWTSIPGSMSVPHAEPAFTVLPDGRVLVIGGSSGFASWFHVCAPGSGTYSSIQTGTNAVDGFDPATGAFFVAPSLPQAVVHAAAAVLPDGRVWLAGGGVPQSLAFQCCVLPENSCGRPNVTWNTFLFDGASWSAGPNLPTGVAALRINRLQDGSLLATGGALKFLPADDGFGLSFFKPSYEQASTQVVRFDGSVLTARPPMTHGRFEHVAATLPDGTVLFASTGGPGVYPSPTYNPWFPPTVHPATIEAEIYVPAP